MTRQEATIITDIKKFAKLNDRKALTMYAKQLAQLRESRTRLMGVKSTVGAVGMQVTAMASQAEAMAAVGRTAGVMAKVNAAMGPQAAGASMANFQRQMEVANFFFTLF